jgi:hypothetical protein
MSAPRVTATGESGWGLQDQRLMAWQRRAPSTFWTASSVRIIRNRATAERGALVGAGAGAFDGARRFLPVTKAALLRRPEHGDGILRRNAGLDVVDRSKHKAATGSQVLDAAFHLVGHLLRCAKG